MSFWDEHAKAEAAVKVVARLPQNAPATCGECGHHGPDVLFGGCAACFAAWKESDER